MGSRMAVVLADMTTLILFYSFIRALEWPAALSINNSILKYIFFFQGEASFNFMAAVTISNDFETQENKDCHCHKK